MDNVIENFWFNGGAIRGKATRKNLEDNNKVLRHAINDYTIDSCWTFDEGYETAIWYKDHKMIIVERYNDEEEMKKGHKKWCEFVKNNPKEVYSVQLDEICEF